MRRAGDWPNVNLKAAHGLQRTLLVMFYWAQVSADHKPKQSLQPQRPYTSHQNCVRDRFILLAAGPGTQPLHPQFLPPDLLDST